VVFSEPFFERGAPPAFPLISHSLSPALVLNDLQQLPSFSHLQASTLSHVKQ